MKKSDFVYIIINIIVILLSVTIFLFRYGEQIGSLSFLRISILNAVFFSLSLLLVHLLKSLRLYFTLPTHELSFWDYMKLYCKVTPISMILPMKSGELFKMYCLGRQIHDSYRGVIIVLLDRFMDTFALITVLCVISILGGGHINLIVYILLIFLAFLLLFYYAFPGSYHYWKNFLLSSKSTERRLMLLKMLETIHRIHSEITYIVKGRGIILFIISMIAWATELFANILMIGSSSSDKQALNEIVSKYLLSVLGIGNGNEYQGFVFYSAIGLIVLYIGIKVIGTLYRRGIRRDNPAR